MEFQCRSWKRLVLLLVANLGKYTLAISSNSGGNHAPTYSPVRPPAVPLAVRSPYTSVWSPTGTGEAKTLNNGKAVFWMGAELGWEGIVVVDGTPYEYLGNGVQGLPNFPNYKPATPQRVSFDSHYSNFTFTAGPVNITASFFSPVLPRDVCRSSIPLSYLTTWVQSTDGRPHCIKFYSHVDASWIRTAADSTIGWELFRDGQSIDRMENVTSDSDAMYTLLYYPISSVTLYENDEFPQWGNFSYSTTPMGALNFSFETGHATSDMDFPCRGLGNRETVFSYMHDFGRTKETKVQYTIGSIQDPMMLYLHTGGISQLTPWWRNCYGDLFSMISFHWNDLVMAQGLARGFEDILKVDIKKFYQLYENGPFANGSTTSASGPGVSGSTTSPTGTGSLGPKETSGQQYIFNSDNAYGYLNPNNFTGEAVPGVSEADSYYAIVALSARQVMGAFVYVVPPESSLPNAFAEATEPLVFQKEISSDGNVNTVDVLYPTSPFFLYTNPELLRYTLQPLFDFQEAGFYPSPWAMHDIGTKFPRATGHVDGLDEVMPVEESGNCILMSYAYYKFSGNVAWLSSHYKLLKQFAQYLITFSLVPDFQFSTDDFAGKLSNQTNLALKGIVALKAMSSIARICGMTDDADMFESKSHEYYLRWEYFGIDPSRKHALLAYQWRSSWGLLYNVYYDKLLNLSLVQPHVYEMQSDWYPVVSQTYGVPLDNRNSITKSDWQMWTAAICSAKTRALLVNSVAYWLNQTSSSVPFSDLYHVIGSGSAAGGGPGNLPFRARPVVGGHFAMLALAKSGQDSGAIGADTRGSFFANGGEKEALKDTTGSRWSRFPPRKEHV